MSSIATYPTLADFLTGLGYPVPAAEVAVHELTDVSPPAPYRSAMFRANYYTFVLLRDGHSRYTLDGETYEVPSRTLYFTNPGHLKGYELVKPPEARLLSFGETFLRAEVDADPFANFGFLLTERVLPQTLPSALFAELWELSGRMKSTLEQTDAVSVSLAGAYFRAFLLRVKQVLASATRIVDEAGGGSTIVQGFREQVRERVADLVAGRAYELPQIVEIAAALNLHPAYLATVIKSKTDRTASEWVQKEVVATAQGLLRHSKLSVKEVAFQLGFREASYFSRYFRRVTGISPSKYRRF